MTAKKIKIAAISFLLLFVSGSVLFISKRTQAPALKKSVPSTEQKVSVEQTSTKPAFDRTALSITDPTSSWVVVNKTRPLNPVSYSPTDLVNVGGGQAIRAEAATSLISLQTSAKASGLTISALSGYRSYTTQVGVYSSEVKRFGQAKADSESARPGFSEHQTGWAVDVGGGGCGIEDCFGTTAEGKWLAVHAYEYGFIIRYTADKQEITGYRAEPWHIRYIGTALSNEMHKAGVSTLEEFFNLPAAPDYK